MAGDPNFNSVTLLLPCNGSNNSTTFTDASNAANMVTAFGDAKIITDASIFGGSCLTLDGTGDYLTAPSSANFQYGTGDFTLELFAYITGYDDGGLITKQRSVAAYGEFYFGISGAGALVFAATTGGEQVGSWNLLVLSGGTVPLNARTHLAVTRSGTTFKLFVDGITAATSGAVSGGITSGSGNLGIGCGKDDGTGPTSGKYGQIRSTKGVARYTADFTAPTEAFPTSAQTDLPIDIITIQNPGMVACHQAGFIYSAGL